MAEEIKKVEKPSLLGMITSPAEQFERIKRNPIFWGALIIITIIVMLGMWLTSLGVELPEFEGMSADEIAIGKVLASVGVLIIGLFTAVISILISTVIYLLIAKIAHSNVSFKQLFSMNTYIMLISALSMFVNGILIATIGGYSENDPLLTSLGSFINADGALGILFDSMEIFSIWTIILTAIGLQKVASFSKGLAWTIAIVFFVIGIIFAMIEAGSSGLIGI